MTKPMGTVIVLMEPATLAEDEFNDWYDKEHIPDRSKIQGCHAVKRFVCVDGWPKYLCLYDWDTLDVLSSPAYKAVHDTAGRTPWTVRILPRVQGWQRLEANQIYPGRAKLGDKGTPVRLLLARISGVDPANESSLIDAHKTFLDSETGILQWRLYRTEKVAKGEYWLCVEYGFVGSCSIAGLKLKNGAFDIMNVYAPYWPRT